MKLAFDAAWKLVARDPSLEAVSVAHRRISLGQAIMALFSSGERDVTQLANEATDLVRRLHMPLPGARIGKKGMGNPLRPLRIATALNEKA